MGVVSDFLKAIALSWWEFHFSLRSIFLSFIQIRMTAMTDKNEVVYQLVYQSKGSTDLTQKDVDEIVAISKRNNTAKGISGFLVYESGKFMQLLEGDESVVKDLYFNIIAKDPRHSDAKVVDEKRGPRTCANWSMSRLPVSLWPKKK